MRDEQWARNAARRGLRPSWRKLARVAGESWRVRTYMHSEYYRTPAEIAERSGRVNERFVFGAVRTEDEAYKKAEEALIQQNRAMRQPVSLEDAIGLIKSFQPFQPDSRKMVDPESPIKQFPTALRRFVAEALRAGYGKEKSIRVLFYTAVGSLVDTAFGADAVIEITFESGEFYLVRLDVTKQKDGGNEKKTRKEISEDNMIVVYGEVPDVHEDKAAFDAYVADAGRRIIGKFEAARQVSIHDARR